MIPRHSYLIDVEGLIVATNRAGTRRVTNIIKRTMALSIAKSIQARCTGTKSI